MKLGGGEITASILAERTDKKQFVIALAAPLTADHPADAHLAELKQAGKVPVIVVNELLARGNLPAMTRQIEKQVLT